MTSTVALGGTQQFGASLSTTGPTSATWSVNGVQGGNATVGTIDGTGKYTAPASFPSPNTLTVTASASGVSGNANLTVVYPNNNHQAQVVPIELGTTGGNATDSVTNGTTTTCCSGTLGSLVVRNGTFFILSNNHVLDKSDQGVAGQAITQPGLTDNNCNPGTVVANLTQAAALKPSPCSTTPCTGPAPSNVDAAIAQIVSAATVDTSGSILDLGPASPSSIAAAPPSATLAVPATVLSSNEGVAKSGRSSGLTCSTLTSIMTLVSVTYNSSCGGANAFTVTFNNQIIINGGSFTAPGDSGSLVVTSDTARPLGLIYGGNSTSSSANPIQDVLLAFKSGVNLATIVGGADHAVSCAPTASSPVANPGGTASTAALSVEEIQRAAGTKEKYAAELMRDPAITGVGVGVSADNPKEAALVIFVTGPAIQPIPAQIEGVRTKVILGARFTALSQQGPAPASAQTIVLNLDDINRAGAAKEAHANELMKQNGIFGVGVGHSEDNPAEPAVIIFVEKGVLQFPIPPEFNGVRTKIIEGDRFRAIDGVRETKPVASCTKTTTQRRKDR